MIFLSYSRRDKIQADEIVRALEERAYKVWQDTKNILPGDKYRADIERGIREADIFVILLSPKPSDAVQKELEFADKYKKKIIGVWLKPQKKFHEGYEIILSGSHQIELAHGFDACLARLFEALGPPESNQPAGPTGLWKRTLRKAQRLRAVVANSDLGPAVLKYGAAVVAGAASVAVAVAKMNAQQRAIARQKYRRAVETTLTEYMRELKRTGEMNAHEYTQEFRPRVRRLLGRLEGMEVPIEDLQNRHRELLQNLQRTVDEYDDAFEKLGDGDIESCRRAVQRFAEALIGTVQNYLNLLESTN